jgi:diguanylate cyclase (GGDEF)-like protein
VPHPSTSFRPRRVAGFVALLGVMAALSAAAVMLMGGLQARSGDLARHNVPQLDAVGRIRADVAGYRLLQLREADAAGPARSAETERRLGVTAAEIDRLLEEYRDRVHPAERGDADAVIARWDRLRGAGPAEAEARFAEVEAALLTAGREERAEAEATLAAGQRHYQRSRIAFLAGVAVAILASAALGLWLLVVRPMRRAAAAERFRQRLGRAVEMADSEAEALGVVEKALAPASAAHPAELLLADSSQSHLRQAVAVGGGGAGPGCPVDSPRACVAVRRGQAVTFPSSESLDACPKLGGRPGGPCSAVCVPVTVLGRAIGVLHATGADGEPATEPMRTRLEAVADLAGSRLGVIRAMSQSQLQASTDPLTGLFNRRSLEDRVQDLRREGVPFIVAMGDLDRFKRLNDTFGHETGDRALRLFARCLAETVRAQDVVARYGGEEFVVVMPRCSAAEAAEVIDRVRARLAEVLSTAETPAFTVSFGVAESAPQQDLNDTLQAADAALLEAKRSGRDRTLIASGIGRIGTGGAAA